MNKQPKSRFVLATGFAVLLAIVNALWLEAQDDAERK